MFRLFMNKTQNTLGRTIANAIVKTEIELRQPVTKGEVSLLTVVGGSIYFANKLSEEIFQKSFEKNKTPYILSNSDHQKSEVNTSLEKRTKNGY